MPKKPAEACMFCGGTPCQCEGSGAKKKRSQSGAKKNLTPKPKPSSETISPSVDTDRSPTEDAFGGIPDAKKSRFKSKSASEKDLTYLSALRNLRDMVCEKDQRWIDKQVSPTPSAEVGKRLAAWRKRNET